VPASEIRVVLAGDSNNIVLEVDGSGAGSVLETEKASRGLGIISIEERVRLLNGTFFVLSRPGEDSLIRVSVPLRRQNATD
jgi:signal transduction histidine kinase